MIYKLADNIISPLGVGTEANYRAVKAGRSALKAYPATELLPEGYFASLFEENSSFDSRCIACAEPAIRDADIDASSERVLFIISSTKANVLEAPAEAALKVARHFGNPNTPMVVSNACISGLAAQIEALRAIEFGRCDYAVVIGADVIGRFIISGFQSLKALSPEQCKPFDANRCGLNLGEAAACIVYGKKPLREGKVWCAVSGAICNDANHISGPSRTGEGSYRALSSVIAGGDRQSPADDTAFINVHGTSTLYNDEMESIAIDRAGLADIPVNTLKGYFGHTLGAAGVLETILSMAAVEDGTVLGTRGFETLGVSRPLRLSSQNAPIEGGKQSFIKLLSGFGGVNAAMLFSRRAPESVFANNLIDNALQKIDAPKQSIDFTQNVDNQKINKNAQKGVRERHTVEITPDRVVLDGKRLMLDGEPLNNGERLAKGSALLEAIYRKYIGDWPKFFKMDPLARLGFVASELLLKAEAGKLSAENAGEAAQTPDGQAKPDGRSDRAVILFNRSGSLADDVNYQRGIDGPDHLGSPSLFVYTLPNIVTGEIAIRNKYFAETSFYCIPEPDEDLMRSIVAEALEPGMSAIAGWCECSSENDFCAKMYILEG